MCAAATPSPAALSIGELSRRARVNIETIRYYERIKMLPAPPRTTNGRRVYGPVETRTLTFIRRSRELGFNLDQIRAVLALSAKKWPSGVRRSEGTRSPTSRRGSGEDCRPSRYGACAVGCCAPLRCR